MPETQNYSIFKALLLIYLTPFERREVTHVKCRKRIILKKEICK